MYVCNCGIGFEDPMARTAHSASCVTMLRYQNEQLLLQLSENKCDCMAILQQTKDAMEIMGQNVEAKGVGEAMLALWGHHALKGFTEKRVVSVQTDAQKFCDHAWTGEDENTKCKYCGMKFYVR